MNIREMIKNGSDALFVVSGADLREFFSELVAEAAEVQKQQVKDDILMSASEVCEALEISANSLWRWGKTGYLRGSKVGRKTFYHKADVDALLRGKGA